MKPRNSFSPKALSGLRENQCGRMRAQGTAPVRAGGLRDRVREPPEVHLRELGQVDLYRLAPQPLAQLRLEEVVAVADHVVQQEEAIRLAQEQHVLGAERQPRVVGAQKAREARLEE